MLSRRGGVYIPHSLWHGTKNSWVETGDVKTKKDGVGWGQEDVSE